MSLPQILVHSFAFLSVIEPTRPRAFADLRLHSGAHVLDRSSTSERAPGARARPNYSVAPVEHGRACCPRPRWDVGPRRRVFACGAIDDGGRRGDAGAGYVPRCSRARRTWSAFNVCSSRRTLCAGFRAGESYSNVSLMRGWNAWPITARAAAAGDGSDGVPSPSAPAPPRAPTVLAAVNGPDDGIVPQARAPLACARASDTCDCACEPLGSRCVKRFGGVI